MEKKKIALKPSHLRTQDTVIHLVSPFISVNELTQEVAAATATVAACA